jgi:hypothetical protein
VTTIPQLAALRRRPSTLQIVGLVVGGALVLCCSGGLVGAFLGDPEETSDARPAPAVTTTSARPPARAEVAQAPTTQPAPRPSRTSAAPRTTAPKPTPAKTTQKPAAVRTTTSAPSPRCHPNYGYACVPIASDVDCAGGSGNGPAYVQGPVKVIGDDVYGLDRDGDGWGCEAD